jgi:para-nitrobenzyl esterase
LWSRGRASTAKTNAYTCLRDHELPGPDAAEYGAFPSSELPYALNTPYVSKRLLSDADKKIGDQVSSYWANFAAPAIPMTRG